MNREEVEAFIEKLHGRMVEALECRDGIRVETKENLYSNRFEAEVVIDKNWKVPR